MIKLCKIVLVMGGLLCLPVTLQAQVVSQSFTDLVQYAKEMEDQELTTEEVREIGEIFFYNSKYERAKHWYGRLFQEGAELVTDDYYNYGQALKACGNFELGEQHIREYAKRAGLKYEDIADEDYFMSVMQQSGRYTVQALEDNTKDSEYPVKLVNGELYFTSNAKGGKYDRDTDMKTYDLMKGKTDISGNLISTVKVEEVKSKFNEGGLAISEDGELAFFTQNTRNKQRLLIKRARIKKGKWKIEGNVHFCSSNYSVAEPVFSNDGKQLYFVSDMPGGFGKTDIYVVDVNADGTLGQPKNLGPEVNTLGRENFPFVDTDGTLYFSSTGRNTLGGFDVFASVWDSETATFEPAINLGAPVNSSYDDFAYVVGKNNRGYFGSDRESGKGRDDIYIATRHTDIRTGDELDKEITPEELNRRFNVVDVNLGTIEVLDEDNYRPLDDYMRDGTYYLIPVTDDLSNQRVLEEPVALNEDGTYFSVNDVPAGNYYIARKPVGTVAEADLLTKHGSLNENGELASKDPLDPGSYYMLPKDAEVLDQSDIALELTVDEAGNYSPKDPIEAGSYFLVPKDEDLPTSQNLMPVDFQDDGTYKAKKPLKKGDYYLVYKDDEKWKKSPFAENTMNVGSHGTYDLNDDLEAGDYYLIPKETELLAQGEFITSKLTADDDGTLAMNEDKDQGTYYLLENDKELLEKSALTSNVLDLREDDTYRTTEEITYEYYYLIPKDEQDKATTRSAGTVGMFSNGSFEYDSIMEPGEYYMIPLDKDELKKSGLVNNFVKVENDGTYGAGRKVDEGEYYMLPLGEGFFGDNDWIVDNGDRDNPLSEEQYYLIPKNEGSCKLVTVYKDGTVSTTGKPAAGVYQLLAENKELFEASELDNNLLTIASDGTYELNAGVIAGRYCMVPKETSGVSDILSSVEGLQNIYFDLNSSVLDEKAMEELEKVLTYLKKNPQMNVRISGHTDQRGTVAHNKWLSERRAKRALEYLIENRIDEDRLVWEAAGELFPIKKCQGGDCDEKFHALNRRVEFVMFK